MSALVDLVAPARMGHRFRWLVGSSWVSNLSDGIALAAGPLLVASQTRDPFLIALATMLQRLPWLLFGLYAGVVADRHDRRRIIVGVNIVRGAVLALLSIVIVLDVVNVGVVLVTMFVLGTAETFADTTTDTLLPMVVERDDLGVGNARLMFGSITINRLAGPPIGALLFALGLALPFVAQVVCLTFAAGLVNQIRVSMPARDGEPRHLRAEVADGVRWLWGHPPIRTLTLTVVTFNVTYGAAWSILVLYTIEQLQMGEIGFGLITTAGACGGILGTFVYATLERRIGRANIMRGGLIIETLTHLTLALTTSPAVALCVFFVFGLHESAWGTTATTIRQRAVPTEFQGRVGSVYMMGVQGGLVVGALIGGAIAAIWGVTGPFWFAFAGSAIILVSIWRELGLIATDDH